MQALLEVVLPVFLVIGAGYAAVWRGLFTDGDVAALMRFVLRFAVPCLLFQAISTLNLDESFDLVILTPFYAGATLGYLAGLFGAHYFFGRSWEDSVAIGFCCLFSNSLLLGLPITERAYGPDALAGNYAIISIHAIFCYVLGMLTMEIVRSTGQGLVASLRRMVVEFAHNGLVIGIVLGLAVNLAGVPIPGVLSDAVALIARSALPAALFGLGGVLSAYRPEGDLRIVLYVSAISLILHPVAAFLLGKTMGQTVESLRSSVVTAAMAPGVNAYAFAALYGTAQRVAATSVLVATALSIVTVWVWLIVLP